MSFSQDIKDEIFENIAKNNCCKESMRYGELVSENNFTEDSSAKKNILNKDCCKKAYIKGVFLGSGCIVNPDTDYHFEVSLKQKKAAEFTAQILQEFNLTPKMLKRGIRQYVVYLKDSEQIATILRILEANKSMLAYENTRVTKSIRNDINRSINCETANMTKVFSTAEIQLEAIEKLTLEKKYDNLSPALKEIAKLRLKFTEDSIQELADKCNPKITKSGANHRLNKIIQISKEDN